MYSRLDNSNIKTSITRSGTGLGLYICKKILSHYNGTIDCKSEIGKGSTFTFTIDAERIDISEKSTQLDNKVSQVFQI